MHQFHIPQCTFCNRNGHISVTKWCIVGYCLMHCGICKMGLWSYVSFALTHPLVRILSGDAVAQRTEHSFNELHLLGPWYNKEFEFEFTVQHGSAHCRLWSHLVCSTWFNTLLCVSVFHISSHQSSWCVPPDVSSDGTAWRCTLSNTWLC